MSRPEIDDDGPEQEPTEVEPCCDKCGDTGWRPVLLTAEGTAGMVRCDRCWPGEDNNDGR